MIAATLLFAFLPYTSIFSVLAIFFSAFVAGMMNAVAGGGTLLTFPTLLWMGRDPIVANITSTLGLIPASIGGMIGYRRELVGSRKWMIMLGAPSIVGGIVGAYLLLRTPSQTFAVIIPYLILFATVLFAAGEPVNKMLRRRDRKTSDSQADQREGDPRTSWWIGAIVFQFFVAIYVGYFGAGAGILMLAAMGLLGFTNIHQMNGLKNFLGLSINGIAAVYFSLSGSVNWADALIMAVGAIAGGYGGAGLAQMLGPRFVRRAVVVIGLVMTISLLFRR